jgi:anti-sigma factor RsiW
MTECQNETLLQAWLDGELSPAASEALRSHLTVCTGCSARFREAQEVLSLIGAACQRSLEAPVPTAALRARIDDALAAPGLAGRAAAYILFSRLWNTGAFP